MQCYYAPTFLDESLTFPDKKGQQRATGFYAEIFHDQEGED
jgi:hypothetical protein